MDKNITAAINEGINDAFKRADMQNNLAIGISYTAAVGGIALTGIGIYTTMKSDVTTGATIAIVGMIATCIGAYKFFDSIERKKLSSALVKSMDELQHA